MVINDSAAAQEGIAGQEILPLLLLPDVSCYVSQLKLPAHASEQTTLLWARPSDSVTRENAAAVLLL